MAQHGNRSEQHVAEIHKFDEASRLENVLEQKHEHKEVEDYFETKAHERSGGHEFIPKATAKEE